MAVADLNHDGIPDLVIANEGDEFVTSNDVSVLVGRGDGTFAAERRFTWCRGLTQSVVVADVNHDGIPDLVTANRTL